MALVDGSQIVVGSVECRQRSHSHVGDIALQLLTHIVDGRYLPLGIEIFEIRVFNFQILQYQIADDAIQLSCQQLVELLALWILVTLQIEVRQTVVVVCYVVKPLTYP